MIYDHASSLSTTVKSVPSAWAAETLAEWKLIQTDTNYSLRMRHSIGRRRHLGSCTTFLSKSPIFVYFVSKCVRKASGILFVHKKCFFNESFGFHKPLKCPGKMSIVFEMIEPAWCCCWWKNRFVFAPLFMCGCFCLVLPGPLVDRHRNAMGSHRRYLWQVPSPGYVKVLFTL